MTVKSSPFPVIEYHISGPNRFAGLVALIVLPVAELLQESTSALTQSSLAGAWALAKGEIRKQERAKKRKMVLKKLQRERDSNVFIGRPARV